MDNTRPRRLRKVADILKELQKMESSSSVSSDDLDQSKSSNFSDESDKAEVSRESNESQNANEKKKQDKKVKVPKLKTFNKLLDLSTMNDDYSVEEFEFLRDQPLELDSSRPNKKQLDQKVFKDDSNKASYSLAKSVITNKDEADNLVVNNPLKVTGFISKNISQSSREVFREGLRSQINSRKTGHIDNEGLFFKPATDFDKRDEKQVIIINDLSLSSAKSTESKEDPSRPTDFSNIPQISAPKASSPVFTSKEEPQITSKIPQNSQNLENPLKPQQSAKESSIKPQSQVPTSNFLEYEADISGEDHSSDTIEDCSEEYLKSLIDDSYLPKDNNYTKHVQDLLEKESKEIQKVINAEFKSKQTSLTLAPSTRPRKKVPFTSPSPKLPQLKVFSKAEDDFDEDSRLASMNQLKKIHNFGYKSQKFPILDEKSTDYLKLFEKPDPLRSSKSLLCSSLSQNRTSASSSSIQSINQNEKTIKKPAKAFFILKK